jgi:serine/threonine-protein kinase
MAPELHTGGQAGPTSDVYSLGCLLWATVSGHAPYTGTSDYQIISAHVSAPIPQLPETNAMAAAVNRVLRIAMAKQPSDRYRDAGAMRDDLRAAQRMSEGAAPTLAGPTAARPSTGGRTGLVVVMVSVIVLGLIGLGVTYAVTRGGDEPSADPTTESTPSESSPETPATDDSPTTDSPTTDSPTTEPPDTESYTPQDGDEEKAVANLTEALQQDETLDAATAGCMAETLVEELGVERMVEAGMLNSDLSINNDPMSTSLPADVSGAVFSAAFDCALSGVTP